MATQGERGEAIEAVEAGDAPSAVSLLEATLDSTDDGIIVVDASERIRVFNRRFVEMWRIPRELVAAGARLPVLEFVLSLLKHPEECRARIRELDTSPEEPSDDVLELLDGRLFERRTRPYRAEGKSVGRVFCFRDVTAEHRAAESLRESERKYRDIFDYAPIAIYQTTRDGLLLTANAAFARLLGFSSPEEIVGTRSIGDLYFDPKERDRLIALYEPKGSAAEVEVLFRRKDGSPICVQMHAHAVKDEEGRTLYFEGFLHDLTSRKRAEEALLRSERRYRSLFERNLAGFFRSRPDGKILECNDAFARLYGFGSREEAMSTPSQTFYRTPGERQAFLKRLKEEKTITGEESPGRRHDGKPIWILENVTWIEEGEGLIEGTVVDITERKELEEQLRHAQKMEAVGRLAGGLAHDFNNLLTVINGYTDLLLSTMGPDDPRREDLVEIRKAGDRAAGLTRQLLAFSRRQVLVPMVFDPSATVSQMGGMLRRLIGEDIELAWHLDPLHGRVKADPGQIEQVVMNLVVNARDAMPGGGRLTLTTASVALDEDQAAPLALSAGPYVMLAITDTGIGMSSDVKAHLFEPFFTTKPHGKGTGLGLPTVYGIVRQSGGGIRVESEPAQGTEIRVYLPRVDAPEDRVREAAGSTSPGGRETLLLVEDEKAVRALAREALERAGYVVLEAGGGTEALRIAREHPEEIALLVSDIVMPGMNGRDLAGLLTTIRPGLPVLFVSGYPDDALAAGQTIVGAGFLAKPFTADALVRRVRDALDQRYQR
ncbi:MAG TPA: PAS domain S-box protein [Thermoanaerobaculia bacterium]|nr:PAS domain S-box protein [Thermoanaerobaculia bacterium]